MDVGDDIVVIDKELVNQLRKEFGSLADKIIILISLGYSVDNAIQTAIQR